VIKEEVSTVKLIARTPDSEWEEMELKQIGARLWERLLEGDFICINFWSTKYIKHEYRYTKEKNYVVFTDRLRIMTTDFSRVYTRTDTKLFMDYAVLEFVSKLYSVYNVEHAENCLIETYSCKEVPGEFSVHRTFEVEHSENIENLLKELPDEEDWSIAYWNENAGRDGKWNFVTTYDWHRPKAFYKKLSNPVDSVD